MHNFPAARFFNRSTQPTMLTLMLMASISALAMNIYLPSLPQMALDFSTTPAAMGLLLAFTLGPVLSFNSLQGLYLTGLDGAKLSNFR